MGLLNVGKRMGKMAMAPAGATAIGGMIALDRQDMGTWAMDYTEDALLGTTNADEVFTGGQRSITSPFTYKSSPLKYMNDTIGSYRSAMEAHPISMGELGMRAGNRRYNRTSNQAIDGSMVFGMYNLRR